MAKPDHLDLQTLRYAGPSLENSRKVVVALHGRYADAQQVLSYAPRVGVRDVCWIAPQAENGSWLPDSFLAPLSATGPSLSGAMATLSALQDELVRKGFGRDKIVFAGFSQGACLALEYVARNPNKVGAVVAMSGGLIGTHDVDDISREDLNGFSQKLFAYTGTLKDVPICLSCHTNDPVIPIARVRDSAKILHEMGATIYLHEEPGKIHAVQPIDISNLSRILSA